MFHDVRFPTGISYGSKGGPGYSTNIVENDAGVEQRIARYDQPKHSYDVGYGVKSLADLAAVRDFYIARHGCAYSFRFKDWMDYRSSSDGMSATSNVDQQIGVGNGATTTFQLVKNYQSGPSVVTRVVLLPVSGTVTIALNGVNQASGWTVNLLTGFVTFSVAPANGVIITAGFEFDVPVRFGKEIDTMLAQEIEGFDSGRIQSIPLIEVTTINQVSDDRPMMGTYNISTGSNFTINLLNGGTQVISTTSGGVIVTLPNPASFPDGGPLVTLINGGANSFTVKTHTAATLVTLAAGQAAILYLGVDSGGTKVWYAV